MLGKLDKRVIESSRCQFMIFLFMNITLYINARSRFVRLSRTVCVLQNRNVFLPCLQGEMLNIAIRCYRAQRVKALSDKNKHASVVTRG